MSFIRRSHAQRLRTTAYVQNSPSECPLALALKDLGYGDVSVSRVCSRVDGETWAHDQRTSRRHILDKNGIIFPEPEPPLGDVAR